MYAVSRASGRTDSYYVDEATPGPGGTYLVDVGTGPRAVARSITFTVYPADLTPEAVAAIDAFKRNHESQYNVNGIDHLPPGATLGDPIQVVRTQ